MSEVPPYSSDSIVISLFLTTLVCRGVQSLRYKDNGMVKSSDYEGKSSCINSQTRPLHASKKNETIRQGSISL